MLFSRNINIVGDESSARKYRNFTGLAWPGLVWSGLVWSGLDWNGLFWPGLVSSGLDWAGVKWSGLDWYGLDWTSLDWSGLYYDTSVGKSSTITYLTIASRYSRHKMQALFLNICKPTCFKVRCHYQVQNSLCNKLPNSHHASRNVQLGEY